MPKRQTNPRNGLCLSVLHDKAFDRGLISLSDEFRVKVSSALRRYDGEPFIRETLLAIEGFQIFLPERFLPDLAFIKRHRDEVFLHQGDGKNV